MQITIGKVIRGIRLAKSEFNAFETTLRVARGVAEHHPDEKIVRVAKATADALAALSDALKAKEEVK